MAPFKGVLQLCFKEPLKGTPNPETEPKQQQAATLRARADLHGLLPTLFAAKKLGRISLWFPASVP